MNGNVADFSRPSQAAGSSRDYAIIFAGKAGGNAAAAADQLEAHLGQCRVLRQWAAAGGGLLTDSGPGLETLEGLLVGQDRNRPTPWRLRVETGLFVGTVLVRNLPTARWTLLPKGYPVVHLGENTDLV